MTLYEKLEPWFALKSVPGIGNYLFRRLMERFGSPRRVFQAPAGELAQVTGITPRLVANIHRHRLPAGARADLVASLERGYRIVTFNDTAYPELLRHLEDPPPFLYVNGRLTNASPHIAVVGSRSATRYGLSTAGRLSADLASLGFVIVSGMARGIDTAAHQGALSAGGDTAAVLGSGLEHIYPSENRRLSHRIAEHGALISEFSLHAEPEGHHFPARNRIISGMCLGTVVIEAGLKSGSLITARLAAEQNREVFAVPGSIRSFRSTGTHALIKQGAKLVEHVGDIVEEFAGILQTAEDNPDDRGKDADEALPTGLSSQEKRVCEALGPYPVHIDDLIRRVGMDAGRLSAILLDLELKGVVDREPGNRFVLSGSHIR
jgi:DNA processing protein